MITTEVGVGRESDYYLYTPSVHATNMYFYPICCGQFDYLPGYHLHRNSYNSFLIIYLQSGSMYFRSRGKSYTAYAGQIVMMGCYDPHEYGSIDGSHAMWIHIDGPLAKAYYEMIISQDTPVITLSDTYRFNKYLTRIYQTFKDNSSIKEALLNNWIVNILTELLTAKDAGKTETTSSDTVEDIIAYIREHLVDNLTLELLASKASLSPFYFTRVFKKETGFTPHEYIIATRVDAAKFLLQSTDDSIKEICFKSGFANESSFCTTFKKRVGITPTLFRERESTH